MLDSVATSAPAHQHLKVSSSSAYERDHFITRPSVSTIAEESIISNDSRLSDIPSESDLNNTSLRSLTISPNRFDRLSNGYVEEQPFEDVMVGESVDSTTRTHAVVIISSCVQPGLCLCVRYV